MSMFSEKRSFVRSFCAMSVALLTLFSSLVTATAAIASAPNGKSGKANDTALSEMQPPAVNVVVLDNNGERITEVFSNGTVADFLKLANVEVKTNQIVYPPLNTEINESMFIYVRDAKPVKVTDGGKTKTMILALGTVEEAFALAGAPLGKEDVLNVKRTDKIEKLDKLTVQRVTYKEKVETEEIAFETERENSDKVELGETKLKTTGKNGEKKITKSVKYIDGKAVSEKVVSEKVTKKPVNEVILVGTKGAGTTGGAGTFTDENGVTVAYKEVLTGSGTAYTAPAGALTATGVPAYHGGVAIDPNLIPYGSKLYVESVDGSIVYGYCTAVDTGGFCDDGSGIIDVFYDTYDECVNWGRRDVNVYVIE